MTCYCLSSSSEISVSCQTVPASSLPLNWRNHVPSTILVLGGYVNWVPCPDQWWWAQQRRIWTHFQQPLEPLSINNWPVSSAAVVVEHFHCYCHHSYICPACPSAQSCWHGNWFVLNGVTSVTAPAQPYSETPSFPRARVRNARSALVSAQPLKINVQAFMIHRNHQEQHIQWTKWNFTSCRRFDSSINPILRLWSGKCAAQVCSINMCKCSLIMTSDMQSFLQKTWFGVSHQQSNRELTPRIPHNCTIFA